MGLWSRLHTASAVALLPALVIAPALGAVLLAAWLVFARARRAAPSRDAALVLAVVIAVLAVVHGGVWATLALTVAAGAALAMAVARLDAGTSQAASMIAGLGAAGAALSLAVVALAHAADTGFAQVATGTYHPNSTAALALALAGGSALALRGGWAVRFVGALGVLASLTLLVLTGSRGGLVGLAFALAVLGVVALARLLVRGRRPLGASVFSAGATLALLVSLQTLLAAPDQLAPWLPDALTRSIDAVEGAASQAGAAAVPPLLERLRRLEDPFETSGGRHGAWMLAREMIATRPVLGFGFDAIDTVYAPGAASELADPLPHPHHGILTMLLQGGSLFAVAVLALLGGLAWRVLSAGIRGDAVAALVAASFLGLVAMELLDSVLRVGAVGGIALVVLVMGAGSSGQDVDTTPSPTPPPPVPS